MINVRPYLSKDFGTLLPILNEFNAQIQNNLWNNLVDYAWEEEIGHKGMVIEVDNCIKGFLSYINSVQKINNLELHFCNISSWIVQPEFRSKSLSLLFPLFKLENIVILNLSPHSKTIPLFERLRFKILSEYEYIINPFKFYFFSKKWTDSLVNIKFTEITSTNQNDFELSEETKRKIRDHKAYTNIHFYLFTIPVLDRNEKLILAFNQKKLAKSSNFIGALKEMPYKILNKTFQFELFYTSSAETLYNHFNSIILSLIKKTNLRSINISEHFLIA